MTDEITTRTLRHAKSLDHAEHQYLDLLRDLLFEGDVRQGRNGEVASLFGRQLRFDLSDSFPLLTTKRVHMKSIIHELLWMLRGDTNVRALQQAGVTIWDEWADENGHLGPVYGHQWRSWKAAHLHPNDNRAFIETVDQIANVVESLKSDPYGRRHVVSAWNPGDIPDMALPACHCLFQFHVSRGKLSCQLYQRSADAFLGLPFNIASYSLLTLMMAKVVGLEPGEFIHTLGDVHLYGNHFEAAIEQVRRNPRPFPQVEIDYEPGTKIDRFEYEDFRVLRYHPMLKISAPVSK